MNKIEDFGEKIGGARKDMYALYNIDLLNDAELEKVTRDKIWKRPNIQKLLDNGEDKYLLYFKECIRKALPAKPYVSFRESAQDYLKAYIQVVSEFKTLTESLKEIDVNAVKTLFDSMYDFEAYGYTAKDFRGKCIKGNDLYRLSRKSPEYFIKCCEKERFGMSKNDKKAMDIRKAYSVMKYIGVTDNPTSNGESICYFETTQKEEGRKDLKVRSSSMVGTFFLRPGDKFYDLATWIENTYVVLNRGVKAYNLLTEQDARNFIENIVALEIQTTAPTGNKKKAFPYQLLHVRQINGQQITGNITGNDYLNTFAFRGGEFGNWMDEMDRQQSLNMGYIALCDLASVLGISNTDISLNGNLAIAFGARGHSKARAHYEPDRNVINLTKMSGAGSLAHEWAHALDAYMGKIASDEHTLYSEIPGFRRTKSFETMNRILEVMRYSEKDDEVDLKVACEKAEASARRYFDRTICNHFRSDDKEKAEAIVNAMFADKTATSPRDTIEKLSNLKQELYKRVIPKEVRENLLYGTIGYFAAKDRLNKEGEKVIVKRKVDSNYYRESLVFAKQYSKEGGYWESLCEMFARAFDCFVKDKLAEKGIIDNYLSGHAEAYTSFADGETIRAYPYGDERKVLNELFEKLIKELIDEGLLILRAPSEISKKEGLSTSGGMDSVKETAESVFKDVCAKQPVQMSIFDFLS